MSEEKGCRPRLCLAEVASERIKAFFVARKLKQYTFAAFAGLVQASLSQWLRGSNAPSLNSIESMAASLDVKPKCLICRADDTVCKSCTPQRRPPRSPGKL